MTPLRIISFVLGLTVISGVAAFVSRMRRQDMRIHWALELFGDVIYSVAAGFSAWYVTIGLIHEPWIAAAAAVVGGHMGARWMFLLQNYAVRRFNGERQDG
jgi:hypothetical protein